MGCLGTLKSSGMLQGNKSLHMVLRRTEKKNYFQVALRYNSSLGRRGKKVTETFYQISEKSTNSRVSADPAMCPSLGLFLCRTSHEVAGKERATYTEQFTAKWFVTHWSW